MKHIAIILTLVFSFLLETPLQAQRLISYELQESLTKGDIIGQVGISVPYGADTYKVNYLTPNLKGEDHSASGLLIVPTSDDNLVFPLACYQHGTVGSRDEVPSRGSDEARLALILAANGFVTVAPDYVGLGDSPGIHPYVHADTEASAGLDFLLAARELQDEIDGLNLNDQLFITGYSQGGHAALALQREIELNQTPNFTVTASAPMSGPYSLSEKMRDFTLGDDEYTTVAYLAWTTLAFREAYPAILGDLLLEDYFKPEYVEDIKAFEREELTLRELNDKMIALLESTVGKITPKDILLPDVLNELLTNPDFPLNIALADNDVYDWTSNVPTRLLYCEGDDQVTFENAILASEVMNANGSTMVEAQRMDTDLFLQDHGGCVLPATFNVLGFFNGLKSIELSSTGERLADADIITRYQEDRIIVDIKEDAFTTGTIDIHNMSGKMVRHLEIANKYTEIDASTLTSGMYIVTISDGRRLYKATKVVK